MQRFSVFCSLGIETHLNIAFSKDFAKEQRTRRNLPQEQVQFLTTIGINIFIFHKFIQVQFISWLESFPGFYLFFLIPSRSLLRYRFNSAVLLLTLFFSLVFLGVYIFFLFITTSKDFRQDPLHSGEWRLPTAYLTG